MSGSSYAYHARGVIQSGVAEVTIYQKLNAPLNVGTNTILWPFVFPSQGTHRAGFDDGKMDLALMYYVNERQRRCMSQTN